MVIGSPVRNCAAPAFSTVTSGRWSTSAAAASSHQIVSPAMYRLGSPAARSQSRETRPMRWPISPVLSAVNSQPSSGVTSVNPAPPILAASDGWHTIGLSFGISSAARAIPVVAVGVGHHHAVGARNQARPDRHHVGRSTIGMRRWLAAFATGSIAPAGLSIGSTSSARF